MKPVYIIAIIAVLFSTTFAWAQEEPNKVIDKMQFYLASGFGVNDIDGPKRAAMPMTQELAFGVFWHLLPGFSFLTKFGISSPVTEWNPGITLLTGPGVHIVGPLSIGGGLTDKFVPGWGDKMWNNFFGGGIFLDLKINRWVGVMIPLVFGRTSDANGWGHKALLTGFQFRFPIGD